MTFDSFIFIISYYQLFSRYFIAIIQLGFACNPHVIWRALFESTFLSGPSSFSNVLANDRSSTIARTRSSGHAISAARYPSLCQFATGTNLGPFDSSKMVPHHRRALWFVPRPVRANKKPIIIHAFHREHSPVLAAR